MRRLAVLLFDAVLVACSSSSSTAGLDGGSNEAAPAPDAASDGARDAPGDATGCIGPAAKAPSIAETQADAAFPPAFTGGAIADGTYFMTQYTSYAQGASLATASVTLQITAGVWELTGPSGVVTDYNVSTPADAGDAVVLSETCPSTTAFQSTFGYSVSGNDLSVFGVEGPNTVAVFTRQ